jgi:preprotein translocase subunit SecA
MTFLERLWEFICDFFAGLTGRLNKLATSIFGSANEREIKKMQARVAAVGALESRYEAMSDEELTQQTNVFRERLAAGETLDDILVEAFAVGREGGKRFLNMRHYDVQLMGGMVLHSGQIAEMVTGEGKTLVATLAAYLNALTGEGVHVVTVNDYLARRDMEWMGPLYTGLGLTVAAIQNDMEVDARQKAYDCDITYGTNNEFGFDYLRDNMRRAARGDHKFPKQQQQSQGHLTYAIIDEVDNILIDEARTPLIISGPAHDNIRKYADADRVARQLRDGLHFEVNEKDHNVGLTDEGVREAERLAGVESFYTAGNMEWPHLIDNSLKAHYLYKRDVNYVVKEGRVVIVDEFTGRLMEGRQWSDGLHQAVEAKEGVKIKEETQTLATITLQNFFKLYKKLAGMTGTAMTEASEFWKIYELDVVAIPTNREMQRLEFPDLIYCTEEEKYKAIADDIERLHKWDVLVKPDGEEIWGTIHSQNGSEFVFGESGSKDKQTLQLENFKLIERKGRPVLVGTTSIEKSELLAGMLERRGIKHEVLNAKFHKREAEIVAQAGRKGAVTIATNMAGRGTDIVLGGNPETLAWAQLQDKYETRLDVPRDEWDELVAEIEQQHDMQAQGDTIKQLGGLCVIGTERHEARRIDLQLRGRCGRQGDPGSSRFYLSLRDDLMRIFAGPWVEKIFKTIGMPEGEAIESRMVTRRIESAQKKVEERNFEIRKNLLEYDEVMDEQRKRVYTYRQDILDGANCKDLIFDMIDQQIDQYVSEFLRRDYGREMFAGWAGNRLAVQLDPKDFRSADFDSAVQTSLDEAERMLETQLHDAVEENLPEEEDARDWNWSALAKFANARWNTNFRDRDLKKVGREGVFDVLYDKAVESVRATDLSDGAPYLQADFGQRTVVAWVKHKFGIELELDAIQDTEIPQVVEIVREQAHNAYEQREADYPVMAALYRFGSRSKSGHTKLDREALVEWAKTRFDCQLSLDNIKNKQREEIRDTLVAASREHQLLANQAVEKMTQRLEQLLGTAAADESLAAAAIGQVSLDRFVAEVQADFGVDLEMGSIARQTRSEFERHMLHVVEDKYRPEIRRMERDLVLQLVDTAWKDHLLAMDHLRSAVGLVGYAQVDPKVEYKREGMRLFDQMWKSNNERVTDLIFRMEQLDEGFVGTTWVETAAVHEQAPGTSEIAQQQQAAIDGTQDAKIETIRNRGDRVGRNDPCPCGSGKKYKTCCKRKATVG